MKTWSIALFYQVAALVGEVGDMQVECSVLQNKLIGSVANYNWSDYEGMQHMLPTMLPPLPLNLCAMPTYECDAHIRV